MKIKFDKDSGMIIKRKVKEEVDNNGNRRTIYRREIASKEINFGSIKNPINTDIFEVRCIIKQKNNYDNFFGEFLR